MIVRWRSVPLAFRDVDPFALQGGQLVADDMNYNLDEVGQHQMDMPWGARLGSARRLSRTVLYAAAAFAIFYLLFWLAPALFAQLGAADFQPDVPLLAMAAITVFASYIGAGQEWIDARIRSHTCVDRGWREDSVFVWVREQDWKSFVFDVEKTRRRRQKLGERSAG
jgi:hypothetical protein